MGQNDRNLNKGVYMKSKNLRFMKGVMLLFITIAVSCTSPTSPNTNGNGNGDEQGSVTGVSIDPSAVSVERGEIFQFSAMVNGANNPSQKVRWSVSGSVAGTNINANGLLSVAANETAIRLTVRAVAEADTSKYGTATVMVGTPVEWSVHNLSTWADAHHGINNDPVNRLHIITVTGNVTIPPTAAWSFTFPTVSDLVLILQGNGSLTISTTGIMFGIAPGQTFIVNDLTLRGLNNNESRLIEVSGALELRGNARIMGNGGGGIRSYGSLTMYDNSSITENNDRNSNGGGVDFLSGTFVMQNNSSITNNTALNAGGGVRVGNGHFIMRDNAKISENTVYSGLGSVAYGGGVHVFGGRFTMEGGIISNNTAIASFLSSGRGGGVSLRAGHMTMYDGFISDNKIEGYEAGFGGGVYITTFILEAGHFTMKGGEISNNSIRTTSNSNAAAIARGGGIFGIPNIDGGTIAGNSVHAINIFHGNQHNTIVNGGGVYAEIEFNKTGGVIYGNYEPNGKGNIAIGGAGHAVYFVRMFAGDTWRNKTADVNDNGDRLDFWLDEIDITYSVEHDNWPPTSLTFTFSDDPGHINASDISFCNNVASGSAMVSGSGTTRTLSPVSISGNGIITTSIFTVYTVYTGYTDVYLIPPAPSGFNAVPTASTITLSWESVALTTGYRIYRSTSDTGTFTRLETTSTTKFVDIERQKTTQYFYRVIAFNSAGASPHAEIFVTTLNNNTAVAIAASSSSIVVEWPMDRSDEVWMNMYNTFVDIINGILPVPITPTHRSTFRIYRNGIFIQEIEIPTRLTLTIGWPPFTLVQDSRLLDHYFVDRGLSPNTTYQYRIDLQFYLDFGIIEIPTLRSETVLTGYATTFPNPQM
jgi:hypothetical protein